MVDGLPVGWAFVGAVLCINVLTSLAKQIVKRANAGDTALWFVLHALPVLIAVGVSLVPEMRVEGVSGFFARLVFFVGIGGTASWWYKLVKATVNAALRKLGASSIPPSMPPPKGSPPPLPTKRSGR